MKLATHLSGPMIDELQHYCIVEPYPFVVDLERSHGMILATAEGQEIIDWAGLYASRLIGYNHPALNDPAYQKKILTVANTKMANPDFLTTHCLDYYRLVHQLAPRCMRNPQLEVYAINSGAEAIENMMKYFINLHKERSLEAKHLPTSRRFLYFESAFHGRTIFALNVTKLDHDLVITNDFHGFVPGNLQVPFPAIDNDADAATNDQITQKGLEVIESLLKKYGPDVVGMVVEPIQGAGGHRVAQKRFFQELSRLCHNYNVSLGFDEVQTAGGQTGALFMVDQLDLPYPPQAVATAKKFGNGLVYMLSPMQDRGVLDSTWGGHLVDMVRFQKEMAIVQEEQLIEQVESKALHLVKGLKTLQARFPQFVSNIRGAGLYQGFTVQNVAAKGKIIDRALEEEQLLLLGAGPNAIRFRPNLHVTCKEIDLLIEKLERVMQSIAAEF